MSVILGISDRRFFPCTQSLKFLPNHTCSPKFSPHLFEDIKHTNTQVLEPSHHGTCDATLATAPQFTAKCQNNCILWSLSNVNIGRRLLQFWNKFQHTWPSSWIPTKLKKVRFNHTNWSWLKHLTVTARTFTSQFFRNNIIYLIDMPPFPKKAQGSLQ